MSEGKRKDKNVSDLSFHTLSDDSSEENEYKKSVYTTHNNERRKTSKKLKSPRPKKSRESKRSIGTTSFIDTTNTQNTNSISPFDKTLQHIQHENKLTYEISVQNTTTIPSSPNTSHSTITTPEYALSYANVFTDHNYRSQENDIPKLVYEKDIKSPQPAPPTKSSSGSERANNDVTCPIDSHSCWGDDTAGFYEDFYENDDMISAISGRGLGKSILGELGVIPGLHYSLRSSGFGNPGSSLTSSLTSQMPGVGGSGINGGLGLNDTYRKALDAILRNEFGKVDDSDGNRIDLDGNYEYFNDDFDEEDEEDDEDSFYDGDDDDDDGGKVELFESDGSLNGDNDVDTIKDENGEEEEENSEISKKVGGNEKKKKHRVDMSFYYELAGHSLLEDEEKIFERYNPVTTLGFSQRDSPIPFVPDLSKGSDNDSDEDVRFTFYAKDEVEENIQMIKQIEETEKVKKALISNRDKDKKKSLSTQTTSTNANSPNNSAEISQASSLSKDSKTKDDKSSTSTSTSPSSSVLPSEAASDNDDDSLSMGDKSNGKQAKNLQKNEVRAKKYIGKRCGSMVCKQGFIRDSNDKYVELRCSAGCKISLHPRCAKKLDAVRKIENSGQYTLEKFSTQCPTPDCWGTLICKYVFSVTFQCILFGLF